MSHIVTIQTRILDLVAVAASCQRLRLPQPETGTAKLYAGQASGLIVRLPGWEYPIVIDTSSGAIQFDNFQGRWGDQAELDRFLQAYAVEKAKLEARKKGHSVTEQQMADGSIKVQIMEGA